MTKATLTPNGDGTFRMSTGNLTLNRVSIQPPPLGLAYQKLRVTVMGYEDHHDGSWSVKLGDLQPNIETVSTIAPAPWVAECLRKQLQAAVDAGEFTLPAGATVESLISDIQFSPVGSMTFIGDDDVEQVEHGATVTLSEGI